MSYMKYKTFKQKNMIRPIARVEKENILKFQETAYKEDRELAGKLESDFPRWSIVTGYYAMHDIAKLYIAKTLSERISGKNVHAATITALGRALDEPKEKKKAVELMEQAEKEYSKVTNPNPRWIAQKLKRAKSERGKAQYYSGPKTERTIKQARDFRIEVVEPFVQLVENIMEAGNAA